MNSSGLSQLGRRIEEPPISWLMRMTLEHPRLISLAAGFTDNQTLPTKKVLDSFDLLLNRASRGREALQYGPTAGDKALRQLTSRRLHALDTAFATADISSAYDHQRLLISNGSQQLLYMVTEALCDPGDIVLVEDPTYFVFLGIAQSRGVRCRGVRLSDDGMDLKHLDHSLSRLKKEGLLSRVKILYLVTYFQNPTSITTSFATKTAALEILGSYERSAGHPIYLLEDAAYRELLFSGEDTPSAIASFSDRVIYTGTYSKPFASGARVGFGLLPPELFTIVQRIKGNHDFGTSNLLQQLMAQTIANGAYERHLEKLRQRYARKEAVMAKALEAHFPNKVVWRRSRGGLYIWATAPRSLRTGPNSELFQAALRKDVLYVPGQFCYAPDSTRKRPNHEMRLSFGGATLRNIPMGIDRLGQAIRKQMKR